ncbi:MAG TPA: alpha-glucan family phosphorylase [Solirubrobacteraceae bacterium]|nr:alpha-glucan family phosphorylase [Solirubrobacteraceae bacterium]
MIDAAGPGGRDVANAARDLASRVPEPLAPLAWAAHNYRWSWEPGADELFQAVDPHRWSLCGQNPVRLLLEAPQDALERAAGDADLVRRAAALAQAIGEDLARPAAEGPCGPDRPVAFVCAEFGVHGSLPIYSGGLGALAGDILKEASDRAYPLVGVGLMYHDGYFHQRLTVKGRQVEYWTDSDPERLPMALVTDDDGAPLTITVPIRDAEVVAQIWRVDVGRTPLFLIDAERPENSRLARWISRRLYVGDPVTRIAQYALLGIGGMRALQALGIEPGVVHLNEGHGAFATLELARAGVAAGEPLDEALAAARSRVVFTTHTPVPAGNDTYPPEEVTDTFGAFIATLGLEPPALLRMGRTDPDSADEDFGVTQMALRGSRSANGVSRRHGEVARGMWNDLWPDRAAADVPIAHVTNGVHVPTWLGSPMRELLDRHLGPDWLLRAADPDTWDPLDAISDPELWGVRNRQRSELVDYVRDRSVADRLSRGEPRGYVEAAARAFDPDVLTVGFARRLATYKRLHLIAQDAQRSLKLLSGNRPIQIILAGKAHPSDDEAKQLVEFLFSLRGAPEVGARVIYLHDYDHAMAARLVRGCDVWVNLPRPPLEASGTSGMKSVMNGGLQLSVLDGWWAEAYDGVGGWALSGDVETDTAAQDARDGAELFRVLGEEIVPEFYGADADGLPRAWLQRIRASLRTFAPAFSATRMLEDYERVYAGADLPR